MTTKSAEVVSFNGKSNPIVEEMKAQAELIPQFVAPPPITSLSDPPSTEPLQLTAPVADAPETVCPTLVRILSSKRGHESVGESEFLVWLHNEIKARGAKSDIRSLGCISVTVPRPNGKPATTLFSSHVDTVDSSGGRAPQKIVYDPSFGHIFLDKDDPNAGTCLGADDGAGVWLMLEMIKAKVPGTYLFHRGEEKGCLGSRALLTGAKSWLEQFEAAIAFDRADHDEVITHQGGQECASSKFGEALAKALNDAEPTFTYKPSRLGVLTDTKIYRGVISECVNLGVGYHAQHGKQETLDYAHLVRLRDACLKVNWDALPIDRDQTKVSAYDDYPLPRWGGQKGFGEFGSGGRYEDPKGYAGGKSGVKKPKAQDTKKPKARHEPAQAELGLSPEQEIQGMAFNDVVLFVEDNPEDAAAMLLDMGSEIAALRAKIAYLKGAL